MNRPIELTENEIYLIDILNTMYTNNMNEINQLTQINQEIANNIFSISMRTRNRRNRSSVLRPATASSNRNNLPNNFVVEYIYNIPPASTEVNDAPTIPNFFNPVTVRPTVQEIERATQITRFGDIANPTNNSCPFSLETFNENDSVTMIRNCGHIFNTTSITNWFDISVRCPICRFDIRNHISGENSQLINENEETEAEETKETEAQEVEGENNANQELVDPTYFTDLIFSRVLTDSSFNII